MRRTLVTRALLATVAVGSLALAGLWSQRQPIAQNYIDRALAERGVAARYRVTQIGFRTQRLEDVSIGDASRPDLTADWAEVTLKTDFKGVRVVGVQASGVRLRGRVVGERVSWGSVDRLLPAPTGRPLVLPDIDVNLHDARIALATPLGGVAVKLDGRGVLSNGFAGRMVIAAPRLGRGDCRATNVRAAFDVAIRLRAPALAGPLRAPSLDCGGVRVAGLTGRLDASLTEGLNGWRGSARFAADSASRANLRVAGLTGALDFGGNAASTRTRGSVNGVDARLGRHRAQRVAIDATARLGGGSFVDGTLRLAGVAPDARAVAGLIRPLQATRATPLGDIGPALAGAIDRASRSLRLESVFAFAAGDASTRLTVGRTVIRSASGATAVADGGTGIEVTPRGFIADTRVVLSGGGLPAVDATLTQTLAGATSGLIRIAPYAAGAARLALTPVRFAARPDGQLRLETAAALDGPVGGGRVEGLRLPLVAERTAAGALLINRACTPVGWDRLALPGARFDAATLQVCPLTGGALLRSAGGRLAGGGRLGPTRLNGALGTAPLALTAAGATVDLGGRLDVQRLAARIGTAERRSRLDVARLDGRFGAGGVGGNFVGLSGDIGRVPLLLDEGRGQWSFAASRLAVTGGAGVTDANAQPRFNRLITRDLDLRLAGGQVDATATLREPTTGTAVTRVTIDHDLARGTGTARLAVRDLAFRPGFQPEALTRLTLGIIANVAGRIDGDGTIRWSPAGVTSDGRFRSDRLDLAAAFGPVEGLRGEVVFDDLLALTTRPGQRATVAAINSGVSVLDGVVDYQLLADRRVRVEQGRWPYAGGELLLEATTLDLGQPSERRLTFRVIGMDAARFVEQLKLQDIAVTGIFDGVLPIVFTEAGGRISGGRMVVRPGGGTLAYVGDVSNAELNPYAKLAFDALKAIRYDRLSIELDGALDGEIVSRVNFNGRNEAAVTPATGSLARQLNGLPFIFNITIRAPFRGLVNSTRALQDPSLILKGQIEAIQPSSTGTPP